MNYKTNPSYRNPRDIVADAIKEHAGLSEFDDLAVRAEVDAIFKALASNGYVTNNAKNWIP